jgi:hypothetical protein
VRIFNLYRAVILNPPIGYDPTTCNSDVMSQSTIPWAILLSFCTFFMTCLIFLRETGTLRWIRTSLGRGSENSRARDVHLTQRRKIGKRPERESQWKGRPQQWRRQKRLKKPRIVIRKLRSSVSELPTQSNHIKNCKLFLHIIIVGRSGSLLRTRHIKMQASADT